MHPVKKSLPSIPMIPPRPAPAPEPMPIPVGRSKRKSSDEGSTPAPIAEPKTVPPQSRFGIKVVLPKRAPEDLRVLQMARQIGELNRVQPVDTKSVYWTNMPVNNKRKSPQEQEAKRQKLADKQRRERASMARAVEEYLKGLASEMRRSEIKSTLGVVSIDFLTETNAILDRKFADFKNDIMSSIVDTRLGIVKELDKIRDLDGLDDGLSSERRSRGKEASEGEVIFMFRIIGLKLDWHDHFLPERTISQTYPCADMHYKWMRKNRHHNPLIQELSSMIGHRGWMCQHMIDGTDLLILAKHQE